MEEKDGLQKEEREHMEDGSRRAAKEKEKGNDEKEKEEDSIRSTCGAIQNTEAAIGAAVGEVIGLPSVL